MLTGGLFCFLSLCLCQVAGWQPDIIQLHDWHAAGAAMMYWDVYAPQGLAKPRIVLTIHNMDNSGECRQDEFAQSGLPGKRLFCQCRALPSQHSVSAALPS